MKELIAHALAGRRGVQLCTLLCTHMPGTCTGTRHLYKVLGVLEAMFPPKRFELSPCLVVGCPEDLDAFVFFFCTSLLLYRQ